MPTFGGFWLSGGGIDFCRDGSTVPYSQMKLSLSKIVPLVAMLTMGSVVLPSCTHKEPKSLKTGKKHHGKHHGGKKKAAEDSAPAATTGN